MPWQERGYYRDDALAGFGGLGGRFTRTSVVAWLLGINFVVFMLDAILTDGFRSPHWLVPSFLGELSLAQGVFRFQLWRWVTFQFLHGSFWHLLMNLIVLFFFGPMMERWWGSRRFLAFYLICGAGGGLLFTLFGGLAPDIIFNRNFLATNGLSPADVSLVGASASIFGILIGAAATNPHQQVMLLIPPIPIKMRTLALLLLGFVVLSLLVGTSNAGGEAAHLGGALLGYVLIKNARWLDWADGISPTRLKSQYNEGRFQRHQQQLKAERAEVDRILDKVRDKGLQSLTRREKKILTRATDRQRRAG